MYDYLIVGAGLYGAVFAHEAKKAGKKVLVIDRRPNIAGNVYTRNSARQQASPSRRTWKSRRSAWLARIFMRS